MREWWIYYRMGYSEYEEDSVVVLSSIAKLLLWIAKYGRRCTEMKIVLQEG